jgi:hypothetical protein
MSVKRGTATWRGALPGLLLAAALVGPAAAAPFDTTAARARGRELAERVRAGDGAALWAAFDSTMRRAMGDSAQFAGRFAAIQGQVGAMRACSSETVVRQGDVLTYRARCRFEKVPDPLLLLFNFRADGQVSGFAVRPEPKPHPSAFLDYETKTALRLPFHGEWLVFWGGRTLDQNYHAVSRDQRFAYDLIVMRDGRSHRGDGRRLEDYYCFDLPIVAPAAGTVVSATDSLPDQNPGQMDRAHPVGNGVVLDHGNGEFSLFAHLRRGSVRVRVGQAVAAGDTLGRCGNSGNTS